MCAVAEYARPGGSALSQVREDAQPRKHAAFTFLVTLPREEFVTLASFGLTVTPADVGDSALVSGWLNDWVQAVADASNVKSLRKFACLLLSWFETMSLGEAWAAWRKEDIPAERLFRLVANS